MTCAEVVWWLVLGLNLTVFACLVGILFVTVRYYWRR